jgi:Holliday junction resolvase RusA-like endonuclease
MIKFALSGPPVAWHRAKLSRTNRIDGGGVRHYKDKGDRNYQSALGMSATAAIMEWAHHNQQPWDGTGEFHLDIEFHVHDLRKRDIDNLEKNVLDALTGIVYDDDQQVVSVNKTKMLSRSKARTIVSVKRVEGYLTERMLPGVGLGAP